MRWRWMVRETLRHAAPVRLHGYAVAAAIGLRAALRPPPPPLDLAARLRMLPRDGAPLRAAVSIRWDAHQIPFIEAAHETDLAVALGVVHAHLRLGQIEVLRRIAQGRVAEMLGPLGLPLDRSLRLLDLGRAVPAITGGLPPRTRAWAEGFVAGINHVMARAPALPHEFELLGMHPEPWSLLDLFLVARLVSLDVSWFVQGRLLRVRDRVPAPLFEAIWPALLRGGAPSGPEAAPGFAGLGRGSNAAAVAARRSSTGGALLASDPHLGLGLPNQWLLAGIACPGVRAVGLMLPGLPFLGIGRNEWIAWGGTALHAAGSDLVELDGLPDPAIATRTERVRVRGGRPRRLSLRQSRHGPVVSDGEMLRARATLALRWVGHRPSDELTAMLALGRARNWDEFADALAGFAVPGQNMIYAGTDGRVGKTIAAHLPRRAGADRLTVPPDEAAWARLATGPELFAEVDPPAGFVASANERPPAGPYPVGQFFAPEDRSLRLAALLGKAGAITPEAMAATQRDTLHPRGLELRDHVLARLPLRPRPAHRAALLDAVAAWDGQYAANSAGALAWELLLGALVPRLVSRDGRALFGATWTTRALLAEALQAMPDAWIAEAAEPAIAAAARRFRRHRVWGAVHRQRLSHTVAGVALPGRRYSMAGAPAPGGNDTLNKSAHRLVRGRHRVGFGACARALFDLADPDSSRFVLLGGQDGWLGSSTWADQVPLWRAGRTVTLPLRRESVRAAFPHLTVLRP